MDFKVVIFMFILTTSLQAMKPRNLDSICVIDTFSSCCSENKPIPCGWYATKDNISMFFVKNELGDHFVKIKTNGGNTTIGKKYTFNPLILPYLAWKWRMFKLPSGARENIKKSSDSGAGVYVIFRGRFQMNHIIKYVWSSSLPVGTITESPFNNRVKIVVLRNAGDKIGIWINEKVNVLKDYRKLFNSVPPMVDAIAIMSDADNTLSSAEADYDDFRICQ